MVREFLRDKRYLIPVFGILIFILLNNIANDHITVLDPEEHSVISRNGTEGLIKVDVVHADFFPAMVFTCNRITKLRPLFSDKVSGYQRVSANIPCKVGWHSVWIWHHGIFFKRISKVGIGESIGAIGQAHERGSNTILAISKNGLVVDPTAHEEYNFIPSHGSWFPRMTDELEEKCGIPIQFQNYAVGGMLSGFFTGYHLRYQVIPYLKKHNVRYVQYTIGFTETHKGISPLEFVNNLKDTVNTLRQNHIRIILGVFPNVSSTSKYRKHMITPLESIQDKTLEVIKSTSVDYVDLRGLPDNYFNTEDGVHLNSLGYEKTRALWLQKYIDLVCPEKNERIPRK